MRREATNPRPTDLKSREKDERRESEIDNFYCHYIVNKRKV